MADIYAPTAADALSAEELALYRAIMEYRAGLGLASIPLSQGLTATAGRHALDTADNIWAAGLVLPEGTNLHSWSDAPYWGDHRAPQNMWEAPVRLGTSYADTGYEISAAGFRDGDGALVGWQGSPGHNNIIVNANGWEALDWSAIGVGIEHGDPAAGPYGGHIYHVWFGADPDPAGGPDFEGSEAADTYHSPGGDARLMGRDGDDVITGGAGRDTINGGAGDDVLTGGTGTGDLSDLILGMSGADVITGGAGNDNVFGGDGNDTAAGGAGADTIAGQQGDDVITGGAWSDLISGGDGFDFINGGWGHDRLSGGGDADRFFHAGHAGHGADWIQDYTAAEADVLLWGGQAAGRGDFLVQYATTAGAGADDVAEAFVTHVPTGQLLWALVDGAGQETLWLRLEGGDFDLLG